MPSVACLSRTSRGSVRSVICGFSPAGTTERGGWQAVYGGPGHPTSVSRSLRSLWLRVVLGSSPLSLFPRSTMTDLKPPGATPTPLAPAQSAASDAARWDARYRAGDHDGSSVHPWLLAQAGALPARGRALDLAGGSGSLAVWLAQRGLDVTLSDVSQVALELAATRAASAGVNLKRVCVDLSAEAEAARLLSGGWCLITCTNYFQPDLFSAIHSALEPRGLFVFAQPTLYNLERHAKPSARFLIDTAAQRHLFDAFELIEVFEGWTERGTHELRVIARR